VLVATGTIVTILSVPGDVSAGVSLRWVACRGSWGRLGSAGSGRWFGGVGGWGWFWRRSGGGGGSIRRNWGRHRLFTAVVVVAVITIVVTVIVTIVIAIIIIAWNRSGSGRWRRSGGLNQGHRSGGRDWIGSWGAIRLTVLLEGFALLHGMATVIEELGVVLPLTTHSKVTGVVGIIRLEDFSNPARRGGRTSGDGEAVDSREGREGDESERDEFKHEDNSRKKSGGLEGVERLKEGAFRG